MPQPTTIGHVSDLHLGPLPPFTPRHWNVKRALGVVNWMRKRRTLHQAHVWNLIRDDLLAARPDHIIVSGDLINVGLPAEYVAALATLEGIGSPQHVSVVPGNHDIYTRLWRDPGVARWRAYMTGPHGAQGPALHFPYVRRIGAVALIALNSARPTPPGIAQGEIGAEQLAALAASLDRLRADGAFRLVVVHHPPLPDQAPWARALRDAAALADTLSRHGAELVIHGHNHRDMMARLATRDGEALVIGIGSASMVRARHDEPPARSAIYTVSPRDGGGWHLAIERRGFRPESGRVDRVDRSDTELPRTARASTAPRA